MRDMQANDKQQSHHKKAHDLWKMFKNTQKSVDSISDIRFNAGMNAREMKKHILFQALIDHESNLYLQESNETLASDIGFTLDVDSASPAQIARYRKVLRQMIDSAESKI